MNRIELLASLCKGSECVCDIGCDHAYVLIEAVKRYNVIKGLACDVANGPLSRAEKSIIDAKLNNSIKTCLSDGFLNVEDEFDTAVIAGMGGSLITYILENGLSKIRNKKLILEPNNDVYKVREFLYSHGFEIIEEYSIIDQNKYYEILVAIPGECCVEEFDIKYGYHLRRNKPEEFIQHYTNKYNNLLNILPKIKNETQKEEKLKEFRELISLLCDGVYHIHKFENTKNYYETYFIDDKPRDTIVVCPGGAYLYTSPRESGPVSKEFNLLGYNVAIIHYREDKDIPYPNTSIFTAEVLKILSKDPRVLHTILLGFSAGGHNSLEVALHPNIYNVKVDLLMLGYPVVTTNEQYWHKNSFENLLLQNFENDSLKKRLSLELEVTDNSVDMFLWTTYEDYSVDIMNSLLLVEAYKNKNRNVEFHLFPMGGHGLSVANNNSAEGNLEKINDYISIWVSYADTWIKNKLK